AICQGNFLFRPLRDIAVRFFFYFGNDQFVNVLLLKMVKLVPARYVDERIVPCNKRSETAFSFRCRATVVFCTRGGGLALFFDKIYRAAQVYTKWVFPLGNRYKIVAQFYIRAKTPDVYRNFFVFVLAKHSR